MPPKKKYRDLQLQKAAKARKANLLRMKQAKEEKNAKKFEGRVDATVDYFISGHSAWCHHLKIGSSNFLFLLQRKLTAARTHGYQALGSDFAHGESWETWMKGLSTLPLMDGKETPFEVVEDQRFFSSPECAFLVASTDFRIRYQRPDGREESALVEVKSTNRYINSRAYRSGRRPQQTYQLQVALHCAGVDQGYLIFAHGDGQTPQTSSKVELKAYSVRRQLDFLAKHRTQLMAGLGVYVASCATYPEKPPQALQKYAATRLLAIQDLLFSGPQNTAREREEMVEDQPAKERKTCQVSLAAKKFRLSCKGATRRVGRPRLPWRELVKARQGKLGSPYFRICR